MRTAFRLLPLLVVGVAVSARADWPQFGGPNLNSTSDEKGLLKAFPAGGPKVLWSAGATQGYSGPAIQGGMVYFLDRKGDDDVLRCLSFETGKEEWTFSFPSPGALDHDGPRCTPAVDEKFVYVVGQHGQVHCVDKATHKSVWSKDLLKEFGAKIPRWGVAQSAVLYKDTVILSPQGADVGLIACEKATGKVVWKSPALGGMQYVTPTVTTIDGVEQILMIAGGRGAGGVYGIDPATGNILWSFKGWSCNIPIPAPTNVGKGRIFITGGYRAGSVMIQVEKSGDAYTTKELWRTPVGSQMHLPMLVGENLYLNGNTNETGDGLVCLDLAGKTLWKTSDRKFDRGNILLADGVFYVMAGGALRIVQPDASGYKELAAAPGLLNGNEIWAPMALTDGKLVMRGPNAIKCVDLKAQ